MQINQFPELQALNNTDIFPASHNDAVYGVKYSTLKDDLAGATSAKMQGVLAADTDLNTVLTAGVYRLNGGVSYTNRPYVTNRYGMLEVLRYSASATNLIVQRLTEEGGREFIRFYTGSTAVFGAWYEQTSNQFIQRGMTSALSVTFPTPFATAPTIIATPVVTQSVNPVIVGVMNRSETGFEVVKKYLGTDGSWRDATASIAWVAFGNRY